MADTSVQWFDRESLHRAVLNSIQKVDVVLDVGCGIRPQTFFRQQVHIFCEPHAEYVKILQNRFVRNPKAVILQGTAQEVVKLMPDKSVDSVFLIDLIEHLTKANGQHLLRECERIARRQIILFTPLGFMRQEYAPGATDGWGLSGGDWQTHKSGWTPDDFDESWEILACREYHRTDNNGEPLDSSVGAFWAIKNIYKDLTLHSPARLAVLSHILPPSPSGQAVVLHRLLKDLDPGSYCLLSLHNYDPYNCEQSSSSRLPARYYHLRAGFRLRGSSRFRVLAVISRLLELLHRTREIVRIVKRDECSAILACSGGLYDLPAGYLASRWTRVPFYAYVFDYYSRQWTQRPHRLFAQLCEPTVLKHAAGVIVPNEFLRDEYRRRYHIEPVVIHNPCDVLDMDEGNALPWPSREGEIRIVYTGAVYHAHFDVFRNLIAVIQRLGRTDVKLHLYTAQSPVELEREGIHGPVVYHSHLAMSRIRELQRQADILFLPLAFGSAIPEAIKTSAPGKMGEYLASGRPILVHAPADSFVSWYFKEYQCGVVVDQDEVSALAEALEMLLDQAPLREQIVQRAFDRAVADFSLDAAQEAFRGLLWPEGGE